MTDNILYIENLELVINDHKLLSNFSLSLSFNERIGITGPSGCGKTTLLKSICKKRFPGNSRVKSFNYNNNMRIGYAPQSEGLFPWYTLKKSINHYINNSVSNNTQIDIDKVINIFGFESFFENYPYEMSGGEIQRAVLANSILCDPTLFLIDEPLTEVDLERKWIILEYWSKLIGVNKASLLIISHDVDILLYLCDDILILNGDPAEIIRSYSIPFNHPRNKNDFFSKEVLEVRNDILKLQMGNL